MRAFITGSWITLERIRVYSWIVIGFGLAAVIGLLATSSSGLDYKGRPLGTDFANVWSAGQMALEGSALDVYDPPKHHSSQQTAFGSGTPYYGWHYPPFFLLIAMALALIPYGAALTVWMVATLPLYLGVVKAVQSHRLTLLVAVAFPATLVNLLHGQNGFLSAALLGAGLITLDRRPVVAGVVFGLLTYKPQFGILIPLVLIATRRWQTFAAATVTVMALVTLVSVVFGMDMWQAFYTNTQFTRDVVLETGAMGWELQQSLFATARALGAGVALAYTLQAILAALVVVGVVWLWRTRVDFAVKAAGLATGALLVTPYVMDYDLVILALAIAWLTAHGLKAGFANWEKTALAAVWAVPLFARMVARTTYIPLGPLVMLGLFGLILKRAHLNHTELTGS